MFYSHTFLARKGPLGTVWCAAHLQHKLKKTHYISTNIPSTVERIMYPDVPIALRMSGHLLLGVVRIYSKQVEYLLEDCKVVETTITKPLAAVNLNLPDDAKQAPFQAVTLPEKFELDALELDYFVNQHGYKDSNIKNLEEITLIDQIPTGEDPYIVISINEDNLGSSPLQRDAPRSGAEPMDEDGQPLVSVETIDASKDPHLSPQMGIDDRNIEDHSHRDVPEVEIVRDAELGSHFRSSPTWQNVRDERMDPDMELVEQINRDNVTATPLMKEMLSPLQEQQEQPSVASQHISGSSDPHIHFEHSTPELEIQETPPVAQPKVRRRKRKQPFDSRIVLSNNYMKDALAKTDDLFRKRKNAPCSSLDIWRINKRRSGDDVFSQPLFTGLCSDLQDIYNKNFSSEYPDPNDVRETHQEAVHQSPLSQHDIDMEENRNYEGSSPNRFTSLVSSPMRSPAVDHNFTPATNLEFSLEHVTTVGTGVSQTPKEGPSTGQLGSDMGTPSTFLGEETLLVEHTALSDIPEVVTSAGELNFLDQDDSSPAGSEGTPGVGFRSREQDGSAGFHALSSRTRAVAQFLSRKSSETPISQDLSGDLSLNQILEGKTRKICARMFFETLVLKNCGMVHACQEKPYGDITLKVTAKLSKEQFSI